MANIKITELPAYADPVSTDVLPIVDVGADATKKVSIQDLLENAGSGTAAAPGIAFDGDSDTGIYRPGANQLAISTNGTGRLFVDSSGNVKIGDGSAIGVFSARAATNGNFHIRDITAVTGSGTGVAIDVLNDAATAVQDIAIRGTTTIFRNNTGESLRITSAGLVGVGTSSPGATLHASGGSTVAILQRTGANACQINVGDSNLSNIYYDADTHYFRASTGTSRATIDSSGRLLVGTSSSSQYTGTTSSIQLTSTDSSNDPRLQIKGNATTDSAAIDFGGGSQRHGVIQGSSGELQFFTNASAGTGSVAQRMAIDSSGRLLVGTSTSRSNLFNSNGIIGGIQLEGAGQPGLQYISVIANANSAGWGSALVLGKTRGTTVGSNTVVQNGDEIGLIDFQGADGNDLAVAARIHCDIDGTPGNNDMPGRLVFSTTADGAPSPTERMRITSGGVVGIGVTSPALAYTDAVGVQFSGSGYSVYNRDGGALAFFNRRVSDGSAVEFARSGTGVGSISVTTTATAYNTSSDYRLKENVTPVTDGITRLQQLKPSRFNFIADPGKTVDGFLAHEVQTIVPEAITGEKDAVDDEGNPEYQGIDQSKLVPLLTAALQEAVAKIESLEARLTAAGL